MSVSLDFTQEADGTYRLPPGIYFNLPSAIYHADPALGSTAIKGIALDAVEWQFDRLYGEDKDTDALLYGSALHARMLEGEAELQAQFCIDFDKSQYPEALDTVAQIKDWLGKYGQESLSGKTKDKLIAMVENIDPDQPVLDVLKKRWETANEGKTALKPKRWAQIDTAARWAQRDPLLSAVMENGTFTHGAPEVSIFYEDRGVRLKARIDRLLRHAIIDLKSFSPIFGGSMEAMCIKAIIRMRYDIQAADYLRAWQRGKELFASGLVFGGEPFEGFLAECFDRQEPDWIWIFSKTKGAPQPLVVPWRAKNAMGAAADQVEQAIETFITLRDRFGVDAEWVPTRAAFEVTDIELPAFFGRD